MTGDKGTRALAEFMATFEPDLRALTDGTEVFPESWAPIDLGPVVDGETVVVQPTILQRDDGRFLLYPGAVNGIHGEPGIGKSWVVAECLAQQLAVGHTAMFLDYEDNENTLVARLRALGVADQAIRERLIYRRPQEPATVQVVDRLCAEITDRNITFVAIDSIGETFAVEGVSEDRDNEVAPWIRAVPRRLADAGACVLVVDHGTKAADNPSYASGSKRKRAAITGASYLVEETKPLGRAEDGVEHEGRLKLTCAKDRHGHFRRGEQVATLSLTSRPDGGVTTRLWPAPPQAARTADIGTTLCARAAVAAAREHGEPLSQNALLGLMTISASSDKRRQGIEVAAAKGALAEAPGQRNSRMFTYVRDLSQEDL